MSAYAYGLTVGIDGQRQIGFIFFNRFLRERIQTIKCLRDIRGIDTFNKVEKKVQIYLTKSESSVSRY